VRISITTAIVFVFVFVCWENCAFKVERSVLCSNCLVLDAICFVATPLPIQEPYCGWTKKFNWVAIESTELPRKADQNSSNNACRCPTAQFPTAVINSERTQLFSWFELSKETPLFIFSTTYWFWVGCSFWDSWAYSELSRVVLTDINRRFEKKTRLFKK
jgi:hypothetical protein